MTRQVYGRGNDACPTPTDADFMSANPGLSEAQLADALLPVGFRDDLLATVELGAGLYGGALRAVNDRRDKRDRFTILEPGDYHERAQDALRLEQLRTAALLPSTSEGPLLVVPRLDKPLLKEEQLLVLAVAAKSGLHPLRARLSFLAAWSDNELSGFDPEADSEVTQFEVLPTAYDRESEGTAEQQQYQLELLREDYPGLAVAGLFHSALLARYYHGRQTSWRDTQVRAVHVKPVRVGQTLCVPFGYANERRQARIGASAVTSTDAARLVARSTGKL
jgi:hypothetical protein